MYLLFMDNNQEPQHDLQPPPSPPSHRSAELIDQDYVQCATVLGDLNYKIKVIEYQAQMQTEKMNALIKERHELALSQKSEPPGETL